MSVMTLLKQAWSPSVFWPTWMLVTIGLFAIREFWALASGRPQDTLSWKVWVWLHIMPGESIGQWSFTDLATFVAYVFVFVVFLPYHFWWMKFR